MIMKSEEKLMEQLTNLRITDRASKILDKYDILEPLIIEHFKFLIKYNTLTGKSECTDNNEKIYVLSDDNKIVVCTEDDINGKSD